MTESRTGIRFEPFTFTIEAGKVKEFAQAIGDPNPVYQTGSRVPPTFATVIEFWGSQVPLEQALRLDMKKVLHASQEYEYLGTLAVGDQITCYGEVTKAYTKAGMNFVVVEQKYQNERGEVVLISRSTIIERG
ncbi:MaoC family dehydratase N-terminal domain-containing protein [Brevibacillus ruminantium]|uniref:MaoC family dehydratase N-terminal domain-containing protein n=1 Tax=Brevibacillus ruminantium TaxID=2950604 RepID=A0ABY4W872_9BACL|nr:MaoC family dehydratase N-terminal domain-containing protein [Brevibacillus ruminantium]USG63372.1 MaoC family dehydratase N-terminal domain-containing protein [Brevibacillus ruminantium]